MSQNETHTSSFTTLRQKRVINPFPGLRPFGFEESHLFFGREGQSDEILNNLHHHRFTAVLGASGSGKSSIMYCGVIPVLYGGMITSAGSDWTVLVTRPGISPIDNLCQTLLSHDESSSALLEVEKEAVKKITLAALRRSSMGIIDALRQINRKKKKSNFFIMVDQFEELFRFINSEKSQEAKDEAINYVNLLITAISQRELPVYIALTMRADFIGDCSQFPELTHLINKSHYLIPQMTRDQLRLAIEGPVAVGGGTISRRLVQQLLNDVGTNPDQLPVLQHALMRTWDYWVSNHEGNEPIDLRHYIAIGKVQEALSKHADEAYEELNKEQRDICEKLFKALTESGSDSYGIRVSARISQIAAIASAPAEEVIKVVETFRQPGRSLLMPPHEVPLNDESVIEISHESLMRIWDRLKDWVREESESAKIYTRLSEAAARHQEGKSSLWRPPDLQIARNWRDSYKPTLAWALRYDRFYERTMNFLNTSLREFELEQRRKEIESKKRYERTKATSIVLGAFAIVALLFFLYGWIKKGEADEKAQLAEMNRQQAEQQRSRAEEERERAERQAELAELSRLEAEKQEKIAYENYLEALLQKDLAMNSENRAKLQARVAEEQREIADNQRKIAENAEKIASNERDRAERLRMLSISQSMAVKSLNINNDQELKGNLAMKAFQFHKRYGGNVYDNYIYDGLYYALRDLEGGNIYREIGHKDIVRAVKYASDGASYFSTGSDGRILRWDTRSMKPQTIFKDKDAEYINYVMELSDDGKWLYVGGTAPYILAVDLENKKFSKLQGHTGPVSHLLQLPGNKGFLSLGIRDNTLKINTLDETKILKKFDSRMTAMALNHSGDVLLTADENGMLYVWNMKNLEQKLLETEVSKSPIHSIAFHPDNRQLAIGNEEGLVALCDFAEGTKDFRIVRSISGQGSRISKIQFSKDGSLMATASYDGSVKLWFMKELDNLPLSFDDHNDYVWSIDFDPSGNYVLAGARDGSVKLWPTRPELLANEICGRLVKNMNQREWVRFVGSDIPYEETCDNIGRR
ncbi:MAG: hypothetical protein JJU28_25140 [Cyclobacteriaceae bacterium]|nr:hypothetical protein [Cyclobacteriaceae bacterium]